MVQHVASRYTDYVIPAHNVNLYSICRYVNVKGTKFHKIRWLGSEFKVGRSGRIEVIVPQAYVLRDIFCELTLPYCWLLVEVLAVQCPVSTLACSNMPVRSSRRDHSSTLCWCKGMDPLPLAVEGITSISALFRSLVWGNTHCGHVILTKWHLPEIEIKMC